MHGDFSRTTFDPADAYRAVLLQQGRVLLDADWNEQTAITAHHDEVRTRDVVGPSGGPAPTDGGPGPFAVLAADGSVPAGTPWTDLRIAPGTYYVDGALAESPPPAGGSGWPLADQPHLPRTGPDPGLPEPAAAEGSRFALYLDVWEHHVTADADPSLLESALGGPDTTTRARTVWQVRALPLTDADLCSDLHAPGWAARTPRQLVAALAPADEDADPCQITGAGGYERLENQLYRVQVHEGAEGTSGGSFLWSRDNGSVVARVLSLTPGATHEKAVLGLDRVGRDPELTIGADQLVEVTSTDRELRGVPGLLARTGTPVGLELPVTWREEPWPATLAELGRTPVVRRWDGGPAEVKAGATTLEGGILVRFPDGGRARTGDYWTVPARTVRLAYGVTQLGGTLEWPVVAGNPLARDPEGVHHRTAPLAVLRRVADGWTRESDCRRLFPPLTGVVTIDLAGGDGQEAVPGDPLPEPVRVVVRNGGQPVAGAWLRAEARSVVPGTDLPRTRAAGHLAVRGAPTAASPARLPDPPGTGTPVVTDSDGVAEVRWLLDPLGSTTQTLTVRRIDDHRRDVDVAVVVTGRLSVAHQVRWTPPDTCTGFAGSTDVQDALARLVTTTQLRLAGGDGQEVRATGRTVPQPVRVVVDSPCGPAVGARVAVEAGGDGTGLVLAAVPGEPTPPTLTGLPDAAARIDVLTDDDGVAAVWWQPAFDDDGSSTLDLWRPKAARAVRVGAQLETHPGLHLTKLTFGTGEPFLNDSDVTPPQLVSGIRADLDGEADPTTVKGKPVVRVELELPWPLPGEDHGIWPGFPVGTRTVTLAGTVHGERELVWTPSDPTRDWLSASLLPTLREQGFTSVLGRYVVDGWAVVAVGAPGRHVNGHARATSAQGRTLLPLPTDDAVTGGVFVQWFRLTGDRTEQLVTVPDVAGLPELRARTELGGVGLVASDAVVTEPAGNERPGTDVRTDPAAGRQVALGTLVTLVVRGRRL